MENTIKTTPKKSIKVKIQKLGAKLSAMVMPNIGIFIGWGILTALFFPDGWLPNDYLGQLIAPTMKYLIPALIGFNAGYNEYGIRGGVIGAFATMGVVIGASINMLIAGMIMGPLAALSLKKLDAFLKPRTKSGLEMLVDNFSLGILGVLLMVIGYIGVEPVMAGILSVLSSGTEWVMAHHLTPLAGLFVPPAQVLFLNNAINHGIMIPLGILGVSEVGKSILFFVEALPGNWIGLLLAFSFFAKGTAKKTAPAAAAILFFGGIGEPAYPFALINPLTILGPICGSMTQLFIANLLHGGLIGPLSPGSIFTFLAMTHRGDYLANISAYIGGIVVSFVITTLILKRTVTDSEGEKESPLPANGLENNDITSDGVMPALTHPIKSIIFACDAGMGSSAMGAAMLKVKTSKAMLDVTVRNVSIDNIPEEYDLLITSSNLRERVETIVPEAKNKLVTIKNLLDEEEYDRIVARIKASEDMEHQQ